MLKHLLLIAFTLLLCSCTQLKQIEGVPEIQVRSDMVTTVSVQSDETRLVTIQRGEIIYAIILLPKVETKKEEK